MWIAALVFLSVGLSDLARAGDDARRVRNLLVCVALGHAPLVVLTVSGALPIFWMIGGAGLLIAWHITTSRRFVPERFALLPVLGLGVVVIAALAIPSFTPAMPSPLVAWYTGLPYWFVAVTSPERFALLIGYAVFLVNSANHVVVAVLGLAGPQVQRSSRTIRGGRIIGPIERLFIFWMAVAGQVLAIGAIIAAKGILRYPEINEQSNANKGRNRGALAEYVLIGSLASWSIAFLIVPVY